MENRNARPSWGIDAKLIDEEMLYLDDAEADRVYHELKEKSDRRRQMEHRQNRLSSQMSLDEETLQRLGSINSLRESKSLNNFSVRDEDFKPDKKESKKLKDTDKNIKSSKSDKREEAKPKESQSCEKIRLFIKKSSE
jgi:hypothetical protein